MWTKKERFEAVLNHELADRPPVSAWRHFTENEHSGADLFVETMLKWQNTYDEELRAFIEAAHSND